MTDRQGMIAKRQKKVETIQRLKKRGQIRKGTGTERPQGGHWKRLSAQGGNLPPPEENTNLPDFTP